MGFPPFYFARGLDITCQDAYISQAAGAAGIRKDKYGLNTWITYTIKVGVGPRHSILRTEDDFLTPRNSQTPRMNSCLMIRDSWSWRAAGPGFPP